MVKYSLSLKKDESEILLMPVLTLLEAASKRAEFRPFSMPCCTQFHGTPSFPSESRLPGPMEPLLAVTALFAVSARRT